MRLREDLPDSLDFWAEAYFQVEVTTSQRLQVEQERDLRLFLGFMSAEEDALERVRWTPRLFDRELLTMNVPDRIVRLIETFDNNLETYKKGSYNETQLRREFIDPFFEELETINALPAALLRRAFNGEI